MIRPDTTLESIPKVSKKILPALRKLGIKTVRDLLFHLPSRYEDFSRRVDIRNAVIGEVVTIHGTIKKIDAIRMARKKMVIVHAEVHDETGKIRATWFNQPYLVRTIKPGDRMSLSGKVALGPNGKYLQNPAYEKLSRLNLDSDNYRGLASIHTGGLVAIYPEARGVTSRWLRFLMKSFIGFGKDLQDMLPQETRRRYQLPEIKEAIRMIHFPKVLAEADRAGKRFNFEKLLLIQLRALSERLRINQNKSPVIPLDVGLIKSFVSSLPYVLTDAQRRSIWEILQDMSKPRPMNRLLEGDVGSGKTVVASAVALLAVKKGYRVAFMAPTEILARQHFESLQKLLGSFEISIGLAIGTEKKSLDADIVVGTHALIQKGVKFENLGLVVVDEQHRFGVSQRMALVRGHTRTPALMPHFLSMSATPIPRTLALSVYGDLDLSILDEMPKSRKEIITKVVESGKRAEAYNFIRQEVNKGRQAFVICPRIEVNDPNSEISPLAGGPNAKFLLADVKAVKEEYKKLSEEIFKDLRVGMLHGKVKSKEKEEIMRKFSAKGESASGGKNHEIDILVSTSVIEVGVDIPNATIMMIEGAERFGLAQLHQFRGRVGRGAEQSYCFLFPTEDGVASRRLRAVVDAKNGFELAQRDLEIRGPGDIFGTRQWGVDVSVLAAITDAKLVREVRREAVELLQKNPDLKIFPELKRRLEEMQKIVHRE